MRAPKAAEVNREDMDYLRTQYRANPGISVGAMRLALSQRGVNVTRVAMETILDHVKKDGIRNAASPRKRITGKRPQAARTRISGKRPQPSMPDLRPTSFVELHFYES